MQGTAALKAGLRGICTSSDNRTIIKKLGDIKGKNVLELGCGLDEASVYFAKKNAIVTATDVSGNLLHAANKVAERYGIKGEIIIVLTEDL